MTEINIKIYKGYLQSDEDIKLKKRQQCQHFVWRKICSACGASIESEHTHEEGGQKEIII